MELSFLLFQKIISMALILLCGFAVRKAGLAKAEQIPIISVLLLYIVVPCTIYNSFLLEFSPDRLSALGIAALGALTAQMFFIFLAWVMKKTKFRANPTEQACLAYPNCGNLIIPLITGMLGPEYVFYISPFIAINVTMAWVHLPSLLSGNFRPDIRKIVVNPNMIAIVFGLICFFGRIRLPGILSTTVSGIAQSVGIFSMLLTGLLMAGVDLKAVFGGIRSYCVSGLRLVIFPLLFIVLIAISGITRRSDFARDVLMIVVIGASAPVATTVLQMANVFGGDAETASAINAMTTLLCIITMPIMLWIYQVIC